MAGSEAASLLCICGTDTDAGKTVVTAALLRAAQGRGLGTVAVKPVQTGCSRAADGALIAPDVAVYNQAAPGASSAVLYTFAEACSPHLAAGRAGAYLDAQAVASETRRAASGFELALVEGAGGLLVPLNDTECLADVFAELAVSADAPALLVVGNKLGAVNHALLTLEALRNRGVEPLGFVLVNQQPQAGPESDMEPAIRRDNREIISRQAALPCLAVLPHCPEINSADQAAMAAGWEKLAGLLQPVLDALLAALEKRRAESAAALLDFDRDHLWHPYTSALKPLTTWQAVASRGPHLWLRDRAGHEYRVIDGMSSWWAAIHGYNSPRLLEALRAQAARLPHVMFGGISHAPAVKLGQKLLELAPDGMEYVFLSDSGSVAVEVAIKMALQYQAAAAKASGQPEKSRLLTVRGGYHGDTLGCMSVCDPVNGMHSLFATALPEQFFAPRPDCRWDRPYDPASLEPVRIMFREQAGDIAAVIIEPVVQGAGGMWFYRPEYLAGLRTLCDEHGCLLILDEVATGFGRTGRMFACEWAGISPDIMCVGKGLTGGTMSLAATLASGGVARGISRAGGVLMHGPTFMGNPLACAVALASLELLEETPWRERVEHIEEILAAGLVPCRELPGVADVRVLGAIGVVEMKEEVPVEALQEFFVRERGVWLRPFGRLIYLMPPYSTGDDDLRALCRAVRDAAAWLAETNQDGKWV
ncbi:MAG: adenosylmethionine--8-amino-7-oxononanoate transaminase [Deltaproteobacteria bacterium]|jgi:adenosylmethionine-8-amino-7-oxononanoate aminotransferase|nr:adenosylmethionine--8-amino-7-oxononanoate transaminase [Deltaproteobacteria bacterium]